MDYNMQNEEESQCSLQENVYVLLIMAGIFIIPFLGYLFHNYGCCCKKEDQQKYYLYDINNHDTYDISELQYLYEQYKDKLKQVDNTVMIPQEQQDRVQRELDQKNQINSQENNQINNVQNSGDQNQLGNQDDSQSQNNLRTQNYSESQQQLIIESNNINQQNQPEQIRRSSSDTQFSRQQSGQSSFNFDIQTPNNRETSKNLLDPRGNQQDQKGLSTIKEVSNSNQPQDESSKKEEEKVQIESNQNKDREKFQFLKKIPQIISISNIISQLQLLQENFFLK